MIHICRIPVTRIQDAIADGAWYNEARKRVEGIQMDIERMAEASNGRAVCNARDQG